MVEAIVPKDRNGLIIRMLFLLALLGVGGGVLFKATTSQAGIADMTVVQTPSNVLITAGGPLETFTSTITDVAGNGAPGIVDVFITLSGTAQVGVDYTWAFSAATTANPAGYDCTLVVGTTWQCERWVAELDAAVLPPLVIEITALPGATTGRTITSTVSTRTTNYTGTPDSNIENDTMTIVSTSDLAIAKDDIPGVHIAGDAITWDITVTNLGPSNFAGPIVVTDTIPAGLSIPASPFNGGNGFTCTTPANALSGVIITCTRPGALAALGVVTLQIPMIIGPSVGSNRVNTANVNDANLPGLNSDTGQVVIGASANLGVTKTASVPSVPAGGSFFYTVGYTASGATTPVAGTITDNITGLAGLNFTVANQGAWVCLPANGTTTGADVIVCNNPAIVVPSSGPAAIITFTVPANTPGGQVFNSAAISSPTADPVPGNNAVGPITVNVTVSADIQLTKCAVDPATVGVPCGGPLTQIQVGTPFAYRVLVTNAGPSDAPANTVSVGDTLPGVIAFTGTPLIDGVSPAAAGWTCSVYPIGPGGQSVTCTNTTDPIPANTTVVITLPVVALPAALAGSTVCNVASANVTLPLIDPNLANNTNGPTGACILITTISDLGITKTANPSEIVPGGTVTYAISVTNAGPSAAISPYVLDNLTGSGTKLVSYNLAGAPGWVCTKDPSGALVAGYAGAIRCTGPAVFNVGANAVIFITVKADILLLGGADTISNVATVNLPGPANSEFLCPGSVASDPEDTIPDANCQHLPDSATALVEITEYDIQVEKTATPTLTPGAPYLPGSVFAGDTIAYTVAVTNLGPDEAPIGSVSLGDGRDNPLHLEGTLDLTQAPQFVPVCTVGPDNPPQFNKSFTCNNQGGGFAPLDTATIGYVATVNTNTPAGTLVCNSATVAVSPFGADTLLSNNESEICNTVVTRSDLTLTKSGPPSAQANQTLTYSIVVSNLGPQAALSPDMYDTIPADTKFQSITAPAGWSCVNNATNAAMVVGTAAGAVLRCDGPQVFPFPGTAIFTLVVKVVAAPVGLTIENNIPLTIGQVVVGNGACVVPGVDNFPDGNGGFFEINDDPDLNNNCDQESTPIHSFAELQVLKTALNPLVAGQGQPGNPAPYNAPATYRIEVKNTGPGVATALTLQDLLPDGVTLTGVAPQFEYISGSTTGVPAVTNQATLTAACAAYTGLGDVVGDDICLLGNLAPGVTLKFNLRVVLAQALSAFDDSDCYGNAAPEAGVQACNRATFTSTANDFSMFNDFGVLTPISEFDDDKQTIGTLSDLSILKVNDIGGPTCSGPGCVYNYTITVANSGPSDTPASVQFTDFFPPNLKILSVDTSGAADWFCETLPAIPAVLGNNLVDVPVLTPITVVCSSNPNVMTVAGGPAVFIFEVEVQAAAVTGSSINNLVCLWTNGTPPAPINDPVLTNNCATDVIPVLNGNTITGTKRLDVDGDGDELDVDPTPVAGFEIFVDDGRGGGVANDGIKNGGELSSVTNATGTYTISGLLGGGPWRVCESPKTGYTQSGMDLNAVVFGPPPGPAVQTPGTAAEVALASGAFCADVTFQVSAEPSKIASGVDFLNFKNFSISGFKFEDVNGNGNGTQELNESGVDVPNFTLYVDYNANGILDPGEPSSTQIAGFPTGDYKISNVGPCLATANICQVREVRTAGWIQTYPHGAANPPITDANGVPLYPYDPDQTNVLNQQNSAANSVPVPGIPGADVPGINFSNFKLVSISGLKFNDLDADGQPREAGEPALGGFKICWDFDILNGCTASDPEVPTTDISGNYTILVGPGTSFDICENLQTSPSGWTATYPVDDSLANCHTAIAADSGDVIVNINFGNFQNIIRGVKWNDKSDPINNPTPDGIWDLDGFDNVLGTPDDETGLPGWLICAIPTSDPGQVPDCNPTRLYKAVTDANGVYEIRDLPGGTTYRICEAPVVGWTQTYPTLNNCHTLAIGSGSGPFKADHIFGDIVAAASPGTAVPFNFGNNSPLPPVDMSIIKTAPSSVVIGANLDFTFAVKNNSAFPAKNVKFTDIVNPLLTTTYVSTIAPTPAAWSCAFVAGTLTCSRTGDMPANTTETVKVRFTAAAVPGGPFTNKACVSADNPNPTPGDPANCSTTNPGTTVSSAPLPPTGADLKVDKAASPLTAPQQLGPNQLIDYRIRVRNLGPGAASFVKVTDVLKSGLKFQSMSNTGTYNCTSAGGSTPAVNATGTVTCVKTTVSIGASNTIVFKVKTPNPVPQDGGGPNEAKVEQCTDNTYATCSTSLNDPFPANNVAQAQGSLP